MVADKTATMQPKGRPFPKGVSGNPKGRPIGSRNRATEVLDLIAEGAGEAVLVTMVGLARRGDVHAAAMIFSRIWPPKKARRININLPELRSPADLEEALRRVVRVVAAGELTPVEGAELVSMLSSVGSALDLGDIDRRISALEAKSDFEISS